jgi:hypothetical protein
VTTRPGRDHSAGVTVGTHPERAARVAVIACEAAPELGDDWPLLRAALTEAGLEPSAQLWTDPTVDWAGFAAVITLGAWDYIDRRAEFLAWAGEVEARTLLLNPGTVLAWNSDKVYLADLAIEGVAIVPTTWVAPGDRWLAPCGDFVVKPSVSAGGADAARYRAADIAAAHAHVDRLHAQGRTVMVQPYQSSVDEAGETALVYLGGCYSHAVTKGPLLRAGAGVIDRLWEREQIQPARPSRAQMDLGDSALAVARRRAGSLTYARVDLVEGPDGRPMVLEVELVEPSLFLASGPGAAVRLAGEVRNQVATAGRHP